MMKSNIATIKHVRIKTAKRKIMVLVITPGLWSKSIFEKSMFPKNINASSWKKIRKNAPDKPEKE
jgi:hypothetical protein